MGALRSLLSNNFLLPIKKGWKFIFIFHDVSDPGKKHFSPSYSTRTRVFIEQIHFLKSIFDIVSLDDLLEKNPQKSNSAAIVFDDGFHSVGEFAHPFLKSEKIPFTVFVNKMAVELNRLWVSDLIMNNELFLHSLRTELKINATGKKLLAVLSENLSFHNRIGELISSPDNSAKVYLNEGEILTLKREGVSFGSHSVSHPVLSLVSDQVLEKEIADNKSYIDNLLGQSTQHFALPFGKKEHFNLSVLSSLQSRGHRYIFSSNPVGFKATGTLLPRIGLTNESPREILFYINRQFLKSINI